MGDIYYPDFDNMNENNSENNSEVISEKNNLKKLGWEIETNDDDYSDETDSEYED